MCADDVQTVNKRDETMRAYHARSQWKSVEVVVGVRNVQCHASMDVVIGVRVMLCHQAIDNSGFSTFLNFPLRVQNLILLSSCINSSSFSL